MTAYLSFVLLAITVPDDSKLDYPGTSDWKLIKTLSQSSELQKMLGVSDEQLESLRKLCEENPFEASYLEARNDLESTRLGIKEIEDRAWTSVNDAVRARMARLLTKEQLAQLRPASLTLEFNTTLEFFSSIDTQRYCQLNVEDVAKLKKLLTSERKSLIDEHRIAREPGTQTVFNSLPSTDAKRKFARYAGPRFSVSNIPEQTSGEPPYPQSFQFVSFFASFIQLPSVQEAIELSPAQIRDIDTALAEHDARMSSARKDLDISKIRKLYPESHKIAQQRLMEILFDEQIVRLRQEMAYLEFFGSYSLPFGRPDFVRYLGLSKEQLQAVLKVAREQKKIADAGFNRLNAEIFERVSSKLPAYAQSRLKQLLPTGWFSPSH